jgi:hypothetical protein
MTKVQQKVSGCVRTVDEEAEDVRAADEVEVRLATGTELVHEHDDVRRESATVAAD